MNVTKRDGRVVRFDKSKVQKAVLGAFKSCDLGSNSDAIEKSISIASYIESLDRDLNVEDIQDIIEQKLMASKYKDVAKEFILYRQKRTMARGNTTDKTILGVIDGTDDYWMNENSNKNAYLASTQRDYLAGVTSTDIARRTLLDPDIVKAHDEGIIHFHDADYFAQHIHNCCLVDAEDILQNGTVINGAGIDRPRSFITATTIITQVIASVASGQYGGQTISIAALAPFVNESRKKIREEYKRVIERCGGTTNSAAFKEEIEYRVGKEIADGVQTLQYQINTLYTTNGQTPFVSLMLYINEAKDPQTKDDLVRIISEIFRQRMKGIKNKDGAWVTPAFPKLLYVLQEDNIKEDAEYWWLTQMAAMCSCKRLVPDYISEKVMIELKGDCYPCMGCRSFLSPDPVNHKYYSRFNQGVCTINLPYVALLSKTGNVDFWHIFDDYLELCHRALQARHNRLLGTRSDVSPIHWQHGGLARLKPGEKIDKLLFGNYSTISLGYAGLWECVYALNGKKLTEPEGEELGLKIMRYMNKKCEQWKAAENVGYSTYGTPRFYGSF